MNFTKPEPHFEFAGDWRRELSDAFRDPVELADFLGIEPPDLPKDLSFIFRVPRSFAQRMRRHDSRDPLLLQVMPLPAEDHHIPGFVDDPLHEAASIRAAGLLHKYYGRALLIVSGACAVNCRYCFRRHFPYAENNPSRAQWRQTLDYIRADPSIDEVIFSGGDPLSANDKYLSWLAQAVADIPQVQRLRVHSRLPVVIPARVTEELIAWLNGTRLDVSLVIHCNHANELDEQTLRALRRLRAAGVVTLSQVVLLAGINDSVAAQSALNRRLFTAGVLPYYLNVVDKTAGVAHFYVSEARARHIVGELLKQLPGYLVPRLVVERPDAPCKVPLFPLL